MIKLIVCTVVAFAAVIMCGNALPHQEEVVGGLGEYKPTDAKVTELVERQHANIIKKICDSGSVCPSTDAKIAVNGYKTQLVSGTNYFVSVTVDDIIYYVRIYKSLTETEEVSAIQGPKTVDDEIIHFH